MVAKYGITNETIIGEAIELTGASLLPAIGELQGVRGVPGAYEAIVLAGQMAYAEAYKYVYLVSIAFGGKSSWFQVPGLSGSAMLTSFVQVSRSSQHASWVTSASTWTITSPWSCKGEFDRIRRGGPRDRLERSLLVHIATVWSESQPCMHVSNKSTSICND